MVGKREGGREGEVDVQLRRREEGAEGGREEEEENFKSFSCAHAVLSLWDIVFLTE